MNAPSFVTNHELDHFLGGGAAGQRQRLRLLKDSLLPSPIDVGRVRRFNIAVYPRFVLAGLVRDLAAIPNATGVMRDAARKVFSDPAFEEVCVALKETAQSLATWNYEALLGGVGERAEDAARQWSATVKAAERELTDALGISFSTDLGIVQRAAKNAYFISVGDNVVEQVPMARVAVAAMEGRAVVLERVRVMAKELDYVMPLKNIPDAKDRQLSEWFTAMMAPATEPVVAEPDVSHHEELPYRRRSAPRRAKWHGASSMTRLPASG